MGIGPPAGEDASDVAKVVRQSAAARQLDAAQAEHESRVRLPELDHHAPREVEDHESAEEVAGSDDATPAARGPDRDRAHGGDLVELRRVARDAVAEIDAPGQGRRDAVGVVLEPAQEAPDAPDGDSRAEREHEEIARRAPLAEDALHP